MPVTLARQFFVSSSPPPCRFGNSKPTSPPTHCLGHSPLLSRNLHSSTLSSPAPHCQRTLCGDNLIQASSPPVLQLGATPVDRAMPQPEVMLSVESRLLRTSIAYSQPDNIDNFLQAGL
ncbi:hypothetical protein MIND_00126700 [Mycena indigotica]|uniref:Uncharacterized protein n=1 Tax=Mycena indigotica TaxID=2126181 RepID=A0A8H6TEV8_9AGAR|nr:uncharacterized protein MIND_00126700 [Mycena indigotica]KAF7316086.1 hypothetical protein MIND_00126700 [Mycena indigotica]